MSTRGVYGFYKNGEYKITYNHSDSYPECLGEDVVKFVRKTSVEEMNKIFDRIILVDEDIPATQEQIEECIEYASLNVASNKTSDWYCLLRKAQDNLFVYKEGLNYMVDNKKFLDDIWCEWKYIINLDSGVLEIYDDDTVAGTFDLKEIPTDWIKKLI
jgi:hypothetical protein